MKSSCGSKGLEYLRTLCFGFLKPPRELQTTKIFIMLIVITFLHYGNVITIVKVFETEAQRETTVHGYNGYGDL